MCRSAWSAALFDSSDFVTAQELLALHIGYLERYPHVYSLDSGPARIAQQRSAFEARASEELWRRVSDQAAR